MAPATRNLTVYAGDPHDHEITVTDGVSPVDLTDRTWAATWRPDPLSDRSEAFSVDTTDALTGVLVTHLTPAQTATMSNGVWDLEGTFIADGMPETLLSGSVTVTKDVTR